jgi:hypothetical protein
MKNTQKFCEVITNFYGEPISNPLQMTSITMDGQELQEVCEFYFKERISESEIRHFFQYKTISIIVLSVLFGSVITALLTFLFFLS